MLRNLGIGAVVCALASMCSPAQVIEFESNGLKYKTLTRSGVTVMFAVMPQHLHEFAIIQVAVSNGSLAPYVIRPEDFTYVRVDCVTLRAASARTVISMLEQKGSSNDVIKLVGSYESALYGNARLKSSNGFEQRRLAAIDMGSSKLKEIGRAHV